MDLKLTKLVKTPNNAGNVVEIDFIVLASDGTNTLDRVYSLTADEVLNVNASDDALIPIIAREAEALREDFNTAYLPPAKPIEADQQTLDAYVISLDVKAGIGVTKKAEPTPVPLPKVVP